MKNNETYEGLYTTIVGILQRKKGALEADAIKKAVGLWKINIEKSGWDIVETLGVNKVIPLTENEWGHLQEELEANFIVRIEKGILVQSKESHNRDLTWWSGKKKLESDNYYFSNYMSFMEHSLPRKVLDVTDEDTDVIMNNLADPTGDNFPLKGMVVGHVQSGKTGNYAALVCKAADAGYRFIVVIAGGQNNLRDQTQKRLEETFIGVNSKGVGNLAGFKKEKMPDCLTSSTSDFKKEIAQARQTTNFENMQLPILVVIKKHTKTLDQLLEWLAKYPNQIDKPMLVIDDESDYASINTKEELNPTVINKKIRLLLRKFTKSAYVAYTATPFANIFIDHSAKSEKFGEDLFPRDFIYALSPPDTYFGAHEIFKEDEDAEQESTNYVVHIPENEVTLDLTKEKDEDNNPIDYNTLLQNEDRFLIRHKSDYIVEELPTSLLEAIRLFILNIGVRNLRGHTNKHNSMLIHITRFTNVHLQTKQLVKEYYESLKRNVKTYGKLPVELQHSQELKELKSTFEKILDEVEYTFNEILLSVCDSIDSVQIVDVHQKMKLPLEYRDDRQTNAIVIGGLSLSRGFTLEGLSISYFLRTTIYYDTLMQMGRWFGYRMGYKDLCRVYLTKEMHNNFKHINNATNDLMGKLKEMEMEKRTPEDFGLAVQTHPDSLLQVTARNKSKFAEDMYLSMDLSYQIKETRFISSKESDILSNERLGKQFIKNLYTNKEYVVEKEKNSLICREVDNQSILDFVNEYKFFSRDLLGLRSKLPLAFIKEFIRDYSGNWDIVVYNGEGKSIEFDNSQSIQMSRQKRTVDLRADGYFEVRKSQLARAKAESIVVEEKYKKKSGKEMRKALKNPVLFLHFLTLENDPSQDNSWKEVDVVGLSFSFNQISTVQEDKITKVKINSVMKQQIEEAIKDSEYDEVFDDE